MAPPVTIYITSLTSAPRVRQHIELLHRALRGLEIPYEAFDLVVDTDAKTRWQRAKPSGMVVGLPGYLVGGEWVGTMDEFENAVESGTLPKFLKQDQEATREGEGELERLMRDMTDSDLDKLAGEIGEGEGSGREVGKVGSVPGGPEAKEVVQEKKMGDPHLRLSDIGASKEEVGEALRSAGTVDGLIAAFEKVEAKEKVD